MKILIVTKNWLGDILFEIPAIEMIRSHYPQAEILCMTHPRCVPMLENQPAIDRLLEFDERGKHRSLFSKIEWIQRLRQENIEQVYFFHRSRTRAFLLMLAGIPKRIGYAAKWPNFLTQAVPEPKKPLHHVDYFVELLAAAGFSKPENPAYRFYFSPQDEVQIERSLAKYQLQNFACFHLGANWEPKRWPPAHFAKLADLLYQHWGLPVVLTGGPGDRELGEAVKKIAASGKIISLIGETSLGELGALFSRAQFVVSGDSGPMHIASGVGTRVAAIFGPTHPDLTGPRGTGESFVRHFVPQGFQSPWYEDSKKIRGQNFPAEGWLSQVEPESIFEAIKNRHWHESFRKNNADRKKEKKQTPRDASRKILVNTLSNIGDVILSTPVLMSLKKQFPHQKMNVIVGPRGQGILEGSRFIDRLIPYDKQAPLGEKIRFLKEIRKDRYEVVVDLKNSAIPFLVSSRRRSPVLRFFKEVTARQKHLEILKWMNLETEEIPRFDFFGENEEKSIEEKLKVFGIDPSAGWIVLVPLAASEVKSWPLDSFQKLVEGLLSETGHTLLLAGTAKEKELLEPLTALNPQRVFNFAGKTSLRELAALIAKSELLVGNDSAAAQLGFEMNHPSVVLFGPTDPKKFARQGPNFRLLQEKLPCVPCEKAQCHLERRACMLDLSSEKVLGACLELLALKSFKHSHENRIRG